SSSALRTVNIRIGTSALTFRTARHTSSPPIEGIFISNRTASNGDTLNSEIASSPREDSTTSKPTARSVVVNTRRIALSSSMINILVANLLSFPAVPSRRPEAVARYGRLCLPAHCWSPTYFPYGPPPSDVQLIIQYPSPVLNPDDPVTGRTGRRSALALPSG